MTDLAGEPVVDARVHIADNTVYTDLSGAFDLSVEATDGLVATVSANGHLMASRHVNVVDGQPTMLHVTLLPEAEAIDFAKSIASASGRSVTCSMVG